MTGNPLEYRDAYHRPHVGLWSKMDTVSILLIERSIVKDRLKRLRGLSDALKNRVIRDTSDVVQTAHEYVAENKGQWRDKYETTKDVLATYLGAASQSMSDRLKGAYTWFAYTPEREEELRSDIEAQGALYRERIQIHQWMDTAMVGGESLAAILSTESAPEHIEAAFEACLSKLGRTDRLSLACVRSG